MHNYPGDNKYTVQKGIKELFGDENEMKSTAQAFQGKSINGYNGQFQRMAQKSVSMFNVSSPVAGAAGNGVPVYVVLDLLEEALM